MAPPGNESENLQEVQLRATLEVIPAYTWYAAPSGALTFVNKRHADYLGLPKDHPLRFGIATGAAWDSHIPLLHPDDQEESRKVWSTCVRTGCAGEFTFRVRNAEGLHRWFVTRAEPLRASDGTLLYWVGVNLEIDELKQAEFYLSEGQRLAHMGSWAFNPAGFEYWSSELFRVYGLKPSGKPPTVEEYLDLVHPEDREFVVREIQKMLANNSAFEFTKRIVRPDGKIRRVRCVGSPTASAGTAQRFVGTGLDVTEQEELNDELRRSEFYLAEGERLGHAGSWAANPSGFIEYWSRELFKIYGLDPRKGAPTLEQYLAAVHPQDRDFMAETVKTMFEQGSGCDVKKRIIRPDGAVRYIRCVGIPVLDNGVLKRLIGTAMDVTEQEQLTQELQRREAYLVDAQRLSHTGSFGWKPDTGEIVWSDETYGIFEYDPAEKPTVSVVLQRTHPQDRALVQQGVEDLSKSGTDFESGFRLLLPDGRVKHVHAIAHATQNASGDREIVGAVTDITERKSTEDKVRRLVEADILGVFMADVHGRIVEANHAFLQMLQYDRQDLVSGRLLWTDLTPAELRERDQRALTEALVNGAFQPYEKEFFRKDGTRLPVLIGGALFQSANEGVVFVLDLSEQKRVEEALRKSEADLLEAQRLSHTGSWRHDVLTGIITISPEVHRILDIRPGEDASTSGFFFGRIHPEDRPIEAQNYERANLAKTDFESDYRIVLPDGSIKHVHNIGHPVLDGSGDIRELVGTVIDITERKRTEKELRRSEMEFRLILDLAPQLIAVYGHHRERLYANRTALDYLGISLDEWRHKSFATSAHPDDSERLKTCADRALSSGAADELELRLCKGDGSYRWFLARLNPLRDEQGQIRRWYFTAMDIEDRKQTEDSLRRENVALREEIDKASMFEEIVGTSPALKSVLSRISKVAPSDSTVLITGETGTGKELVARAIHRRSDRSSRAFVSVNCSAIPRDLIASELFGHEKGAFTGATQQRLGRFELASGGTLFLDEVGELPAETQIALLRVLQEHEFERVGGTRPIRADVRVIAATNRDLPAAIGAGSFRRDLFYRLNVFPIEIPGLRERKEDIRLLVEYFIDRYARKAGKKITTVDNKTLGLLESYPWPGNIRELQNVIERSVIVCETENFSVDESWISQQQPGRKVESQLHLSEKVAAQEKEIIEAALRESRGRVFGPSGAAAKLGIARSTLESKVRSLNINKNRFKTSPEN